MVVASAAVGASARIQARPGGMAVTSGFSVAFACHDLQAMLAMVRETMAPLLEAQAKLIQQHQDAIPSVHQELQRVQEELARRRTAPYPDPAQIQSLEAHVLGLRRRVYFRLVAQDIQTGSLA